MTTGHSNCIASRAIDLYVLAGPLADAEDVAVHVGVVHPPGDGNAGEAQRGHGVAEHLPVAEVAGEHDQPGLAGGGQADGLAEVLQHDVPPPARGRYQPGGEEELDAQVEQVPHGELRHAADAGLIPLRKAEPQVADGPLEVAAVEVEHDVPQPPRGAVDLLQREHVHGHREKAKADVLQEVDQLVTGFVHFRF
jgi:hypothetical protein